jgi:hypothetical protein
VTGIVTKVINKGSTKVAQNWCVDNYLGTLTDKGLGPCGTTSGGTTSRATTNVSQV